MALISPSWSRGYTSSKGITARDSNTIISNCGYHWVCNIRDLDSAKYFSEALGKATVETTSTTNSHTTGTKTSSAGQSMTTSTTGRSLYNPDELMNLGRTPAFVFQPEGHPIHCFRSITGTSKSSLRISNLTIHAFSGTRR